MKILEEICEILTCGVAKRPEYYKEGIPFLSSKNVKENRFILDHYNFISKSDYFQLTKYNKPKKGDILYTRVGSFGEAAVVDFDFDFAVFVSLTLIRPKKEIADAKYLMYYLNSPGIRSLANSSTSGIGVQNLNVSTVRKFPIKLPSITKQQKIAAILNKANELRQYNKLLIAKYDALTQSLFLDMFGDPVKNEKGWKMKCLGDLCDVGSSRRVFVDDLVEQGVPFYRGTEVGQMSLNDNIIPTLFITEQHYEKLKIETGVPKIGDLLMPSICPDGRIFEVTNNNPFYFKDGRVLWIKVNNKFINSVYLKKQLKAIFALDYAKIASGTTFAELKIFALKKINLHYPPIEVQNLFAERVQLIETQKQQAQAALAKSEALFQGLLQQAFNGELT